MYRDWAHLKLSYRHWRTPMDNAFTAAKKTGASPMRELSTLEQCIVELERTNGRFDKEMQVSLIINY
jgi:hypothetical protein